ncbi:hypothetical protein ON010_g17801 [Phytophthora cinnamomi]|nr:hypothetical protein ON010_g17801 [Phytophthora cinnamomi]
MSALSVHTATANYCQDNVAAHRVALNASRVQLATKQVRVQFWRLKFALLPQPPEIPLLGSCRRQYASRGRESAVSAALSLVAGWRRGAVMAPAAAPARTRLGAKQASEKSEPSQHCCGSGAPARPLRRGCGSVGTKAPSVRGELLRVAR